MVDGRKYDSTDFAVVRDMVQLSIYSEDSRVLQGIKITRTTLKVVPFESPGRFKQNVVFYINNSIKMSLREKTTIT